MHPGSHRDVIENEDYGLLSHIVSFLHLSQHMAAVSLTGPCPSVADWRPVSLLSSGSGYDYWSQRSCGLSVGVNRAKYCWNRNSCAVLYPDVANCLVSVCLRWMLGFVQGLDGLGHVVELSWSPSGTGLIVIFPFWSIEINSLNYFFICQEIMKM